MPEIYFSDLLKRAVSGENTFTGYTVKPTPNGQARESVDAQVTREAWDPFVRRQIESPYALELLDKGNEYAAARRRGDKSAAENFLAYARAKGLINGNRQASAMKATFDGLDVLHLVDCYLSPDLFVYNGLFPDLEVHEVSDKTSGSDARLSGVVMPYAQFMEIKVGGTWNNVVALGSAFEDVGMQDFQADGCVFAGARFSGDASGARFTDCVLSYADLSELDVAPKARPRGRDETGVTVFRNCTFEGTTVSPAFEQARIIEGDKDVPLKLLKSQGKIILNGGR